MIRDTKMDKTDSDKVDQLISRFLGGIATSEELEALESWIHESRENLKHFQQLRNIWDNSIELNINTSKALGQVQRKISKQPFRIKLLTQFQRIAAILIIPLMIAITWLIVNKGESNDSHGVTHKIIAAFGSISALELPDGSKVWLNSGSSLSYPEKFGNDQRIVELEGEGFFEVKSSEAVPFLVNTPYFMVKATGTRFNVRAERNFRTPSVTLVEGKVGIHTLEHGEPTGFITNLLPNQHMTIDTLNGKFSIVSEDIYKHYSWKDGKLVFRNDNISEVARRISLQYNVDIEIRGNEIKKYRYRATFESEPLGELLRLLKISSPIDYIEVKPKALPDGSFSRRKIIIFSSNN